MCNESWFRSGGQGRYDVSVKALLKVRELTVELPTQAGWVRPVNEVSARINAGESLGLVGESGSGKTMLSLAVMGLLPPGSHARGDAPLEIAATPVKLSR